ncbi:PREDICTED: peroxidase-like protein 2 [Ipomoea nil]|uniref:peroxidase-like protein 2 n=1 Tax=Ipomoea nil TaxID=35883 RepID=UPI000900D319|nr:PREDICTED: peroxidase-like protein 2 [Ipomoea nil]
MNNCKLTSNIISHQFDGGGERVGIAAGKLGSEVGRGMLAGMGGRVSFGAEDGKVGRGMLGKLKAGIAGKGGSVVVGKLGMDGICGKFDGGGERVGIAAGKLGNEVGRGMLAGMGGRVSFGAEGKVGRGMLGKLKAGIAGNGGSVVVGKLGMDEGICGKVG